MDFYIYRTTCEPFDERAVVNQSAGPVNYGATSISWHHDALRSCMETFVTKWTGCMIPEHFWYTIRCILRCVLAASFLSVSRDLCIFCLT